MSDDAVTVVMLAKGLALGRLSLVDATSGHYVSQGGLIPVPRGELGLDCALEHFDKTLNRVRLSHPDALEGLIPDDVLEAAWAPRVQRNHAAILSLVNYYAGTHNARAMLLDLGGDEGNQLLSSDSDSNLGGKVCSGNVNAKRDPGPELRDTPLSNRLVDAILPPDLWPSNKVAVLGAACALEHCRNVLVELVYALDDIEKMPTRYSVVELCNCVESAVQIIGWLKCELGLVLDEPISRGAH